MKVGMVFHPFQKYHLKLTPRRQGDPVLLIANQLASPTQETLGTINRSHRSQVSSPMKWALLIPQTYISVDEESENVWKELADDMEDILENIPDMTGNSGTA